MAYFWIHCKNFTTKDIFWKQNEQTTMAKKMEYSTLNLNN